MNDSNARKLMGGAALGVAVGTLLPWATILVVNINGIDTDRGQVALAAALTGGLLLLWRYAPWWLQLLPGTIAGGMALWLALDVSGAAPVLGQQPRTGAGCIVTIVASTVWICLAGYYREPLSEPRRTRSEQRRIARSNEESLGGVL